MNLKYWLAASATALIGIFYYYPKVFYLFLFSLYSLILICSAITVTLYIQYIISLKPSKPINREPLNVVYNATRSSIFDPPNPSSVNNLPLIFGRTVDLQLQQIIEYTLRDFISPWLGYVVTKPKNLNDVLREDIWNGILKLRDRSLKIDVSKVIAVDMVNRITVHLEKIRISEARAQEDGSKPVFSTHSYLQNDERELEFLRKLSEIIIIFLLPRGYSLSPLKILLSETLSYKIFYPLIKIVTSPDYINQKIVQTIETRLSSDAIYKRSHEYAAGFEKILKIINNSESLEDLQVIRTGIINDVMHATTKQNLQRAKGLNQDTDENSLSRSEQADAQRLKRYLQQLTFAKNQCEKNLTKLGWDGQFTNDLNLSSNDILSTVVGRRYLTLFLEPLNASSLVGYYLAVEDLKHSPKSSWHQLGAEIFYTYIRVPMPSIKIDKIERKTIETFLLGDNGPEIFYDIQAKVFQTLEEKYFPSFFSSEQYRLLKGSQITDDIKDITLNESQDDSLLVLENNLEKLIECTMDFTNHSTYARNKLEQIQERLDNKNQAMDALKSSVKPESKVLSILEKEIDWLRGEKRQIEAHLMRTEVWSEHLGKWKADIQSVELCDDKEMPQFMILVHVDSDVNPTNGVSEDTSANENISKGWVVLRSLAQFHELHRKLRPLCQDLKSFDLPTTFKMFFLKNDKNSLEKAKGQIQKYLNFILENDYINQSEAIYTFLSPSSEHLKQSTPQKKNKFSLGTFFKSDSAKSELNKNDAFSGLSGYREDDDISTYLEGSCNDTDSKFHNEVDNKDIIAEPLYALMGEIFDMGGVFKWIRKSLISFVQITYGRTISRQIRDSISYLFEESMLHFYASTALKSFWPGGVLAASYPIRSDDMKEMSANTAKALFVDSIPEVFSNLVGAQSCKHGTLKVYNALQNNLYNKQLLYEGIEILMIELFPEIRQLNPVSNSKISKTN